MSLREGRAAGTTGDVAGKGMPAALLMARIYADTRYELLAKPPPAEALTSLNAGVSSSGLGHRFITLAIVVLDPKAHTLTIVNAGHLPPLLRLSTGAGQPASDQPITATLELDAPAPKSVASKSPAPKSKGSNPAAAVLQPGPH